MKILNSWPDIALLVTDLGLRNGMNGRQLAYAARQKRPDLDVLFVTGYAENAVLNHGHLERGMQVMTRPFVADALARRVRDRVGGWRLMGRATSRSRMPIGAPATARKRHDPGCSRHP